ncbi:MAG: hypothetical protein U0T83_08555 [Bacteriovoracaceae bacterium]
MVKEWIEGERADKWLDKWENGFPQNEAPELESLKSQIKQKAKAGIYIARPQS